MTLSQKSVPKAGDLAGINAIILFHSTRHVAAHQRMRELDLLSGGQEMIGVEPVKKIVASLQS